MSKWRTSTLAQAGVTLIDCDHRTLPAVETGFSYVAILQMKEGRIELSGVRRNSREHFIEWTKKAKSIENDVVLSRRCNPGVTAHVPDGLEMALGQNLVLLRADGKKIHPPFLRWLVSGQEWWDQVGKFINVGAVFESLRCRDIPGFELKLPPLSEQKRIAHILGTLNEKIELNRRMNATLEAMARALFQSWFVDFDPVRRNADGATARPEDSLFPDLLQDSKLGEIPKGWRCSTISEVCEINGWTLSKKDVLPELEYVEISEVNCGDIANIPIYARGSEPSRARRRLGHGDTALSTVRPDRGSYFLALNPPENRVASTGFAVLTPTKVSWPSTHAALTQSEVSDHLGQMASGGAYPAVRPEIIGAMNVAVPNEPEILEAFHRACAPLFEQTEANRTQSRTLATLRDTLLPKLLSGELSVEKIDRN